MVPVPFFIGSDLKLTFPITIGTVPLGKSLTSSIGRQDDIPGMFTHTHNNNNFKALEIPITNVVSSTFRHERGNKLQL